MPAGKMFDRGYNTIGRISSYERDNQSFIFNCGKRLVKIHILTDKIFRLSMYDHDFSEDRSWATVQQEGENIDPQLEEMEDLFLIKTRALRLAVNKDPFRLTVKDLNGRVILEDTEPAGIHWRGNRVISAKKMPADEHYYGFGERAGRLDKRGSRYIMKTREPMFWRGETEPLYKAIPFFTGIRRGHCYGVFLDNSWETFFDMGKKFEDIFFFGAEGGELNYYVFYGPDMKEVIDQYTDLTGKISLPPVWSLGYHQSRWSYKSEEEVLKIAAELRKHEIPCDAIALDIDFMDGFRVFTWDKRRFPDPRGLVEACREKGIRLYTIIDPGVKVDENYDIFREGIKNNYFIKRKDGSLFYGYVWPGKTVFPDFTREDVRKWWGNHVKSFQKASGVSGIWNDMNEPSYNIQHPLRQVSVNGLIFYDNGLNTPFEKNRNVFGLLMARATCEGLLGGEPNKRHFVLNRSGYAGIQRYAAVWTGDNISSWGHLALSIPTLLNLGISGIPFVGADIGGFAPWITSPRKLFTKLNRELIARWMQLGSFYPFARNHTYKLSKPQEPWQFDQKVLEISKKYLKLRYRWMPYLYNLFVECSRNGCPPMRALILEFPDDERCHGIDHQFMWGEFILVSPVTGKSPRVLDVYLPRGSWFDFWTGELYAGETTINKPAAIDDIPIFIKAGAIIPCQPEMQFFKEKELNPLIIEVYPAPGISSEIVFQEDDGETLGYRRGDYCTTRFELVFDRKLRFAIYPREGGFEPKPRDLLLQFNHTEKPKRVRINSLKIKENPILESGSWKYQEGSMLLEIRMKDDGAKKTLLIEF